MIVNKISNNKGFRHIFVIIDNYRKYLGAIPLENKKPQTITNEFLNIFTTSKPSPLKIESDRGPEWNVSVFQNFLKIKTMNNIQDLLIKVLQKQNE